MFGARADLAMAGMGAGCAERGGSIVRGDPEKSSVLSSSSTCGSNMGRSLRRLADACAGEACTTSKSPVWMVSPEASGLRAGRLDDGST